MKPWLAAPLSVVFAVLGWSVRGVSASGALVGAVLCFLMILPTGWGGFAGLSAVFLLTWLATRLGYRQKLSLGTAEAPDGRNAAQVLANLATAAMCASAFGWGGARRAFLAAFAAALAEAAADTVSSETGQARGPKARLVTSWREVPVGTNGAITATGTLAAVFASLVVPCVLAAGGVIGWKTVWLSAAAAFLGSVADSFLGATLERAGVLGNNAVNFLSTLVAALLALTVAN
ncbi:MAG: DUF92 domain-containing protein [Acidobacteria bacterium]|nr:DUF92 domain-containing protein [Acidobacteriota bacterium]